ncbi:flagellar motor switch protein FliG [Alicyclobacillus sp. TC]|uniref:Flagellar motor switch protein FliG n=2 Tax=Alicyclobacillus tolerans TaxID=90970 RepID=A0ABT9LX45_9BACL|nr:MULTISPECIES: flagellar motor switch protein FliG [Alicyclobacillus]MDP9728843.1 flagellar motor switch protein FliG [Alicyclobacillus tengchongensis]QRF23723.1 flagellar motor switch protein FliG [Alicyclobacillus sp. TC]SHK34908.1 flagellar motor switch protein FliG [Alicyclobacillus montanus]
MQKARKISGRQKAAILLISLGHEVAAKIYQQLTPEEVEQLTFEIANLSKVDLEQRESVLKEFRDIAMAKEYITTGGISFAREALEKALGAEQAESILQKLTASLQVRPFHFARKADPNQLLSFLQDEHPQTMALVLTYLEPAQASLIISALPHNLQADVARRIALMSGTSPDVIANVEEVLEEKLSTMASFDSTQTGGVDAVVKILNGVDRSTEKAILETLELENPELADEIKRKMFVFEDIVLLDGRSIQRVIRDVDPKDLQLALKVSSEEVQNIVFENMSKRMVETFKEDMEFMGPVRLRDVEDAQQRIVGVIRRLEESGEIIVARGGGDDIIV